MNNKPERRAFRRFPIEFVMETAAKDSEGKKFNDKTVLKNISGVGAKLITQQAGKYFPGQSLELTIHLPTTSDVKACMRGTATVLRIDPSSNKDTGKKSQGVGIAVRFDTLLRFERVDVKIQGKSE
jgi:hypothetical protein